MEMWRNIKGWDRYQVSNLGNVRSKAWGKYRLMSPSESNGYMRVNLVQDSRSFAYRVHRLVAHAFLAMPLDSKLTVDHINEVKNDNRLVNLRIVTQFENNILYTQSTIQPGLERMY